MAGNHRVEWDVLCWFLEGKPVDLCRLMQWLPTYCIAVFGHHKHCIKIFMCRETAYILHVIFHPVHLLYIKTEKICET